MREAVRIGGDEENRTPDPLLARQVLSQLSYTPIKISLSLMASKFDEVRIFFSHAAYIDTQVWKKIRNSQIVVGLSGLEPPTSRLSGVRSNRLSYRPMQGFGV